MFLEVPCTILLFLDTYVDIWNGLKFIIMRYFSSSHYGAHGFSDLMLVLVHDGSYLMLVLMSTLCSVANLFDIILVAWLQLVELALIW